MDVQPINMHHGKTELVVVEVVDKVVQGKPSGILVLKKYIKRILAQHNICFGREKLIVG